MHTPGQQFTGAPDVLGYLTKRFPQGADNAGSGRLDTAGMGTRCPWISRKSLPAPTTWPRQPKRKNSIDGRTNLSWTARYLYTQTASKLIHH